MSSAEDKYDARRIKGESHSRKKLIVGGSKMKRGEQTSSFVIENLAALLRLRFRYFYIHRCAAIRSSSNAAS